MSKSGKHAKNASSHGRGTVKSDLHASSRQPPKPHARTAQLRSDPQILPLPASERYLHRSSQSPSDRATPTFPCALRHSLVLGPSKLPNWELADIEIRLNEKLIDATQKSAPREKFAACRQALRDLIRLNPCSSSLLGKIESGVEDYVTHLESAKPSKAAVASDSPAAVEVQKLQEKVSALVRENLRLSRQCSSLTESIPDTHVSDLLLSLREEVSIHRKREDLLMSIINKIRDQGYSVAEVQKSPRSAASGEESTRNSARDCEECWEQGETDAYDLR